MALSMASRPFVAVSTANPEVLEVLAVELAGVFEIFRQKDERGVTRRAHLASRSRA